MRISSYSAVFALSVASAAFAGSSLLAAPVGAATPPPSPPPIGSPAQATPTPIPLPIAMPTGSALPGSPGPSVTVKPSTTPSPPPDARKGLEGVWEVEIQKGSQTTYTHFKLLHQHGGTLSGIYLDTTGKKYPLAGSVDGQAIRLIVSMPDGTTTLLEGRLDGTTDMVGMMTTSKGQTAFTAAYRPKEKWIQNINPTPGGLGGASGGYTPPKRRHYV